jgi:hypothetical protein
VAEVRAGFARRDFTSSSIIKPGKLGDPGPTLTLKQDIGAALRRITALDL